VVPRASAVVPGAPDPEPIGIHADHVNMIKFASREDHGYKTISRCLRMMVQDASDPITSRWEDEGRVDAVRINSDVSFSIVSSLSEVSETDHFVAREKEFEEMHEILKDGTSRRIVTLHGLGGIGKTQLAIAYSKAHRGDYSAMLWINIKDEFSAKQSFSRIARQIRKEHPSAPQLSAIDADSHLDEVVAAVKQWLEQVKNTRWLMVFDNYDSPAVPNSSDLSTVDIQQFLPDAYHGSIVITTTLSNLGIGQQMQVNKLEDIHDSLQILSNASPREGLMNDRFRRFCKDRPDIRGGEEALHSVGSLYLFQRRLVEAKEMFQYALEGKEKAFGPKHISTLSTVNKLGRVYMVLNWFDKADEMFQRALQGFEQELGPMHDLTLIAVQNLGDLYQDLDQLEKAEKMYQRGLQSYEKVLGPEHESTLNALCNLGKLYLKLERFDEAEKIYQRALEGMEKALRPAHESTVSTLCDLGFLYCVWERLDKAKKMYKWALQGYKKVYGLEHELIFDTLKYLGGVYHTSGQPKKAGEMYQQALQGYEKVFGLEHRSIFDTLSLLGTVYENLGRPEKAKEIYQRALRGYEQVLGEETVDKDLPALTVMECLASLLHRTRRVREAEELYSRALVGTETIFGKESVRYQRCFKEYSKMRSDSQ
ncbi:MAG: hypothetical protein Q9165_008899, partial [Trypethelium subeluteriae]